MLYNLHLLSNKELQHLFIRECKGFMDHIARNPADKISKEMYRHLESIIVELDKRK